MFGPEELGKYPSISLGVQPRSAERRELKPAPSRGDAHEAPPRRDPRRRMGREALADDQRGPVKDLTVEVDLGRQSPKTVPIRLDLESVQRAVDHGKVNPYLAAAQAEFLDQYCVSLGRVLPEQVVAEP